MKKIFELFLFVSLVCAISSCEQIKIDKCLDNGGSWNYKLSKCEFVDQITKEEQNDELLPTKEQISNDESQNEHKSINVLSTADSLLLRYKEILTEHNEQTQNNFIAAFPQNFIEMQETFGYDDEKGPAPHYDHKIGGGMIKLFSEIEPFEKSVYYNKYIDICIGAKWEADNISDGFGIQKQLVKNSKDIYPILNNRSEEEIMSVFRFIFDGPHPDHKGNHMLYSELLKSVPNEQSRIKDLLSTAFHKLMNEEHNH